MAKRITLYVDDETEKLLEADTDKSYSKIFKIGLKDELKVAKDLNEEIGKLPDELDIRDNFKHLPSSEEIEELVEAFEKLPGEGDIKDNFKYLPEVSELQEINAELDKTIEKMQQVKELE